MFTVKMIMIDECGDEFIVDTFNMGEELDEDYMEVWEDMKIKKARERFPEAQRFYFEDSRLINNDPWEERSLDDMILCDYRGICAGESCPLYWKCRH